MRSRQLCLIVVAGAAMWLGASSKNASAEDRLGGHIGFVLPLVTHANGTNTTISDDFVIGFPMGITVRKSDTFAFDLELVPGV